MIKRLTTVNVLRNVIIVVVCVHSEKAQFMGSSTDLIKRIGLTVIWLMSHADQRSSFIEQKREHPKLLCKL